MLPYLQVFELRGALKQWGYEVVGLKKGALVDRMHKAILEEDERSAAIFDISAC